MHKVLEDSTKNPKKLNSVCSLRPTTYDLLVEFVEHFLCDVLGSMSSDFPDLLCFRIIAVQAAVLLLGVPEQDHKVVRITILQVLQTQDG